MLRWAILSVVVVVLAASATLALQYTSGSSPTWNLPSTSGRTGPQPKVQIDGSLTHEFGPMSTQKTGTHKWVVKNQGDANLEIWLAGSSCVCTIAKLKETGAKEILKPGESTEVELEWKTKDMLGEFAKNATIGTNDPSRPEFRLNVHGMVHDPVVMLPRLQEGVLPIGDISSEETKKTSIALFSPERPNLKLTKIVTSRPDLIIAKSIPLTLAECQQLETGGGNRLNIELKPGLSLGTFREEVVIETDHPDQPKITVTLVGSVSGPISVMPSNLRLVIVNSKDGNTSQVNLLVREGRSTNFKVTHKPDKTEIAIIPNDTPTLKGRYRLTLTVPPGTAAGRIDDEIILHTDHPKVSELKIPVNIVVGSG